MISKKKELENYWNNYEVQLPNRNWTTVGALIREVRKDQIFKTLQTLVKSGSISDTTAAASLATLTLALDSPKPMEKES